MVKGEWVVQWVQHKVTLTVTQCANSECTIGTESMRSTKKHKTNPTIFIGIVAT